MNNLWGYDIPRRMQHPVHDEELFMEEALAAIRQAITNDEAGEPTLAPAEPRTSREQAGAKPIPEAGLLSRQATAAVGSAFNTLTETVRKHEPTRDRKFLLLRAEQSWHRRGSKKFKPPPVVGLELLRSHP